ncbi:MAG: hypothetical protein ACR2F2_11940, partial [Pyrinomonadaceae bacterium]
SNKKINLPIRARNVGFVFQDYAPFPHLTARQNIAYGIKDKDSKNETSSAKSFAFLFLNCFFRLTESVIRKSANG